VGLTGVFEPGRRNWSSSLSAGAVRKSASSSSEEPSRKPHHAVTNTSPSGGRQRATSAPSASSTTPASARGPGSGSDTTPSASCRGRQALMDETAPRRIGCSASFELCRPTARANLHTRSVRSSPGALVAQREYRWSRPSRDIRSVRGPRRQRQEPDPFKNSSSVPPPQACNQAPHPRRSAAGRRAVIWALAGLSAVPVWPIGWSPVLYISACRTNGAPP